MLLLPPLLLLVTLALVLTAEAGYTHVERMIDAHDLLCHGLIRVKVELVLSGRPTETAAEIRFLLSHHKLEEEKKE